MGLERELLIRAVRRVFAGRRIERLTRELDDLTVALDQLELHVAQAERQIAVAKIEQQLSGEVEAFIRVSQVGRRAHERD